MAKRTGSSIQKKWSLWSRWRNLNVESIYSKWLLIIINNIFRNGRIDTEQYPERTEPILLKDLTCNGTEERIEDCGSPAWGEVSGCDHSQDLAIFCDLIAGIKLLIALSGDSKIDKTKVLKTVDSWKQV